MSAATDQLRDTWGPPRRPWSRYVAVGDSLSEGLGDPLPGGNLRGWAALVAEHLRRVSPQLQFTNLAVRGHRTRDAIRHQLDAALALRPDLVTVFIGGNDVLLNVRVDRVRFADQLDRLIAPLAQPGVTVVLSTLPDLTACSPLLPPLRGEVRRRVETVNEVIRDAADRYDTRLLDAWSEPRTREHAFWSFDRIHPSAEGHRAIAASVAHLLGVPVDSPEPVAASDAAVLRRYAVEAAWLARYGLRVSARAKPLVQEADGQRAFGDRSGDTRSTPTSFEQDPSTGSDRNSRASGANSSRQAAQ